MQSNRILPVVRANAATRATGGIFTTIAHAGAVTLTVGSNCAFTTILACTATLAGTVVLHNCQAEVGTATFALHSTNFMVVMFYSAGRTRCKAIGRCTWTDQTALNVLLFLTARTTGTLARAVGILLCTRTRQNIDKLTGF
jgi:hypothetical protein